MAKETDRMVQLTERSLGSLPLPQEGRRSVEYSDLVVRGLRLTVTSQGRRYFDLRVRVDNVKKAYRLGEIGVLDLKEARDKALQYKAALARGEDPEAADPKKKKEGITLGRFVTEEFLPWAKIHKRSYRVDVSRWNGRLKDFPLSKNCTLSQRRLSEVSATDLQRVQAEIAQATSKPNSNRHIALISRILSFAVERDLLEQNVARRCKKFRENSMREIFMDAATVRDFLAALDDNPFNPVQALGLRFLVVSGLRRGEALSAKWSDFNEASGSLRLPLTKSGRGRTVPLNSLALETLERAKAFRREDNPFIFPAKTRQGHLIEVRCELSRVKNKVNLPDGLRTHDLRHSFASVGIESGLGLPQIAELLQHANTATTRKYSHLRPEAARMASETIAQAINNAAAHG